MYKKAVSDKMAVTELIIRILIGFFALYMLTRILGRKEISQMTFFNFVSAIAIGSIAANVVVNQSISIRNGVIALVGWSIITFVLDIFDVKFKSLRRVLTGNPVIVIKKGQIIKKSLLLSRLDLDTLTSMLRQQNVFSISEVDYAIFEKNGKLSVLLKEKNQFVTKKDMKISSLHPKLYPIPTDVISDGKVVKSNLKKLNLNEEWLNQQLQQRSITNIKDVIFAQIQTDGRLDTYLKNEKV